jgi:DNA-directed RNA polymerase subunit RPC12/RpoP
MERPMAISFACDCGRKLRAKDEHSGKKVKCPDCGATITIPAVEPLPVLAAPLVNQGGPAHWTAPIAVEEEPPAVLASVKVDDEDVGWTAVPVMAPTPISVPRPVSPTSIPDEPWYYRFLEFYARVVMSIAVIQAACMFLAYFIMDSMSKDTKSEVSSPSFFWTVVIPCMGMLAALLFSAPILLAVDAARNLRAMRWK